MAGKIIKENSTNQLNRKIALAQCPVTFTLEKIGGRWKPLILWHLKDGTRRYSEIRKSLPNISEKMLIQQLRDMEADDLIVRKVLPVVPPHVEYSLTKKGKGIIPVLNAMAEWGTRNQ